jgi:hypothetical protein
MTCAAQRPPLITCADCGHQYKHEGQAREQSRAWLCTRCQNVANAEPLEPAIYQALRDSYSADTIGTQGRTRKPAVIDGQEWISTGDSGCINAYRLAPDDGSALPYAQHNFHADSREEMGGYHGMAVIARGKPMMLVGPETHFVKGEAAQLELL